MKRTSSLVARPTSGSIHPDPPEGPSKRCTGASAASPEVPVRGVLAKVPQKHRPQLGLPPGLDELALGLFAPHPAHSLLTHPPAHAPLSWLPKSETPLTCPVVRQLQQEGRKVQ